MLAGGQEEADLDRCLRQGDAESPCCSLSLRQLVETLVKKAVEDRVSAYHFIGDEAQEAVDALKVDVLAIRTDMMSAVRWQSAAQTRRQP